MSSSESQKTTSSQASEDGQQTINARSVAARLRWEKKRKSDREKQEQVEREARLMFEQRLQIQRQAEDIRREREQYIADRIKAQRVEGQRRRRLNEEKKKIEKKRQELLNIRSAGSGQAIVQQEREHINSPLNAQTSVVCGGEVNYGGEPREQLMRQQIQSNGIVLDDKEYRQRVLEEKQRQTQLFSQRPCKQYILGESKARKYKKYNDRRKAERASKKKPVQKVKITKPVSSTRSAAQKARWASVREKKADMERMAASSDPVTIPKLDLVPKARVRVQPETLYAFLTEEEKYNILLRRGQIKEQVAVG